MHLHDIERELRRRGWHLERITGAHRHYRNAHGCRITLAAHGKRTLCAWQVRRFWHDLALAESRPASPPADAA